MLQSVLANFILVIHLGFILFVVVGGLLVFRWPWAAFIHLPAVLWGVAIELGNWICPLTPMEQKLRLAAHESGYTGGFIEHYLIPLIYPDELTRDIQLGLGLFVLLVNVLIYGWWLIRRKKLSQESAR
jgi:hypothetical protein